ncbi:MAG: carbamoyltransferase C-terminal domain-containing protein [bacterium]
MKSNYSKKASADDLVVLGIHALSHDAGAAVVTPKGMWSISEERLSRKKYEGRFPESAINAVLKASGVIDLNNVDLVVIGHLGGTAIETTDILRQIGYHGSVVPIRHHDAHAASAFFVSPFDDASILIVDAAGSWGEDTEPGKPSHYLHIVEERMHELQTFYRGHNNSFTTIRSTPSSANHRMGIGFFYAFACMFLGFSDLDGGKLMGLAPYGGRREVFTKPIFINCEGDLIAEGDRNFYDPETWEYYGKKYFRGVKPRKKEEPVVQKHAEIAYYVQKETERAMLLLAHNLYRMTRCANLCMAGGVALNSVTNYLILKETPFENLFVQPASSDCGIPLGCALYGYHVLKGQPRQFLMEHAFLGLSYGEEQIKAAIPAGAGIRVSTPGDITACVAEAVADGRIVGWFEGASELGPRALGHRSILADPRRPEMKDILNERVKHREPFRPYAPSVLQEHSQKYFELSAPSPFMLLIAPVHLDKRTLIPSVTHIDGTARLQTVGKEQPGQFRQVIEHFYQKTDIPLILNTSFNVSGEPIVETPQDAVNCFLNTQMDALLLGRYFLEKIV